MVITDGQGTRVEERRDARPAQGAAEPDCPFHQVWRNLVSAGAPGDARFSIRYAPSDKLERAVWNAEAEARPELSRTLDGRSCNFVRR